jgi:hypothetical protein
MNPVAAGTGANRPASSGVRDVVFAFEPVEGLCGA